MKRSKPQSNPNQTPIKPQSNPQSKPQSNPQSKPQSNPQSKPLEQKSVQTPAEYTIDNETAKQKSVQTPAECTIDNETAKQMYSEIDLSLQAYASLLSDNFSKLKIFFQILELNKDKDKHDIDLTKDDITYLLGLKSDIEQLNATLFTLQNRLPNNEFDGLVKPLKENLEEDLEEADYLDNLDETKLGGGRKRRSTRKQRKSRKQRKTRR